ncbi:MAG: hypothetical protein ACI9JL_003320 [Paracoccaceae bacterium]|jgi:hypothetical protein
MNVLERFVDLLILCSIAMFLWTGMKSILLAMEIEQKGVIGLTNAIFQSMRFFHGNQDSELETKIIECNRAGLKYFVLTALLVVAEIIVFGSEF